MKRWRNSFFEGNKESSKNSQTAWFDIYEDWDLIESSFAKQYGIRLREEVGKMSWDEFTTLLAGLMNDTPLGKIIEIRSEDDKDILKHFTKEQHKIRNAWRTRKMAKMSEEEMKQQIINFQNACKIAFQKA